MVGTIMTATRGVLICGIGIKILGIKEIRVGNEKDFAVFWTNMKL